MQFRKNRAGCHVPKADLRCNGLPARGRRLNLNPTPSISSSRRREFRTSLRPAPRRQYRFASWQASWRLVDVDVDVVVVVDGVLERKKSLENIRFFGEAIVGDALAYLGLVELIILSLWSFSHGGPLKSALSIMAFPIKTFSKLSQTLPDVFEILAADILARKIKI